MFLDGDYDYFVKLDVDQTYPSNYYEVMVPLIEKYKCIGPVIYDRWRENNFVPLVFDHPAKVMIEKKGIEELKFLHTNVFFAREVLEAIPAPWYECALNETGTDRAFHVDRHFMAKVITAGYKIFVNYDVTVKHIAEVEIDKDAYIRWNN